MTISFVGATSAAATSLTLPTHAAGDLILIAAMRNNNTASLVIPPAGWETVFGYFSSNNHQYLFQRTAQASGESSGTFANADLLAACVYRSSSNILCACNTWQVAATIGSGGSIAYTQSYTTSQTSNKWFGGLITNRVNDSNCETAPTGMTNRTSITGASANEIAMHDTNGNSSSWASTNVTLTSGTSTRVVASTFEIIETAQSLTVGGTGTYNPFIQQRVR